MDQTYNGTHPDDGDRSYEWWLDAALRAKSDDELIALATDPTTRDSVRDEAIHVLTVERRAGVMFPPSPVDR